VLFYLRYALLYINKLGVAHIKQEIIRLKIFMFAFWAMILTVTGMYTMYIINIGFSDVEISLAVTISTLFCMLGQNFTAYLAERFKCLKKTLLLSIGVGLIVPVILMTARQNWQVFAALALWAFFVYGSVPLSDAWCIGFLKSRDMLNSYGGIRGLGSIGYGLAGVLFGMLL
jgi:PPP family 3-phenylpropionic acid transporter